MRRFTNFFIYLAGGIIISSGSGSVIAQTAPKEKVDELAQYLTDFGGAVSAASIVGSTASAITNIQTSQDLILAINPFSSNDAKGGFSLAITPARTSITPMSGEKYIGNPLYRLIGALTLSYAENNATISGVAYKKSGVSIDTTYFFRLTDDPIYIGYQAFLHCPLQDDFISQSIKKHRDAEAATDQVLKTKLNEEENQAFKNSVAEDVKCQKAAQTNSKWNANRISLSYGDGRIEPEKGGTHQSLGKSLAISGVFGIGVDSALNLTYRRTIDEYDFSTEQKTPLLKNSNLAAVRITTGSSGGKDIRWLIEASNANQSSSILSNSVFKYAMGLDKKVLDGVWLEFRYGKSKTVDGKENQSKGLLSLNWSPTSTLFKK